MGHSLGGLVALGLAERFPQHFAGALVMCGVTGGSQATVDYIANIRVLFDFFYPGALPGDLLNMPAGTRPEDVQARAAAAMTATLPQGSPASLRGALAMAAVMEELGTPIPHIRDLGQDMLVRTLVGSIVYAVSFHARGFSDLIDRTHGHSPFDNTQTVYSSPVLPSELLAALNAGVGRFATTPDARNYLRKYYAPSGDLAVPVVTLNNRFDPIAPLFHVRMYRDELVSAGRSDLLTRRSTANPYAYGHCAITVDETMAAFADLAARVGS